MCNKFNLRRPRSHVERHFMPTRTVSPAKRFKSSITQTRMKLNMCPFKRDNGIWEFQQFCQPMRTLQDAGTPQENVGILTGFLAAKLYHYSIQSQWLKMLVLYQNIIKKGEIRPYASTYLILQM